MSGEPAGWVRKRFTPVFRCPAITLSNLILYGARRHERVTFAFGGPSG